MKRLLVALAIFVIGGGLVLPVYAMPDPELYSEYCDEKEKPIVQQCPKTKMTEDCLRCHTIPNFKLKEAGPDEGRNYPNSAMWVRGDVGYLILEDIWDENTWEFFDYLTQHDIKHAVIEVYSWGGDLMAAWRIVGMMRFFESQGGLVETRCHGIAASAGALIFVSGTMGHRFVTSTAEVMFHELWTFAFFKFESPSDKEDEARVLRHLQDTMNEWIASKSAKMDKETLDAAVKKKEYWLRGSEMIEVGFADGYLH